MPLVAGARLGTYEIVSPLGAGGMGEVYRARDIRLGRDIAVKVLPEGFAQNPDRLARFEREARALASLNHPNVAAIYGFEAAGGIPFLVLELVPGETLEERLGRGRLPVEQVLSMGAQIAEALEAAHEQGIIHRDLKPGNVKVTPEGKVKVLDFGLAKTLAPSRADSSEGPTLTSDGTRAGMILGTPAYMSPEQARGQTLDKRTDLWSFGCLLYALLTGRGPFAGPTASDTIAAILGKAPDWSALPHDTPPLFRQLLHRCLEKDPSHRLRDAGDARIEIEQALAEYRGSARPAPRHRLLQASLVVLAAAALALGLLAIGSRRVPAPSSRQPRLFQVTFSEGIEEFPSWSPDGTALAYSGEAGGIRKIFTKRLASGEDMPLTTGAADDIQPAWSPDGRTILFVRALQDGKKLEPGDVFGQYDAGDIWAFDLDSRKEAKLLENAFNPSWSADGSRIAVDASWGGPRRIWVVDRQGHNPQQVTTDVSEAFTHLRPRWSPDGTKLAFQNIERT
jgi:serine/threonine protein kinase